MIQVINTKTGELGWLWHVSEIDPERTYRFSYRTNPENGAVSKEVKGKFLKPI